MGAVTATLARRAAALAVALALLPGVAAPPAALAIEPVATSIDMTTASTPTGGVPFTATVMLTQVDPPGPATMATGDVTVAEGATTLATCTLASGTCDVTLTLAAGDHTLTVSYPGDAGFAAATKDVSWNVVANTIEATGVGLSYATFYPYKDGYRDTVTARGTRNEAASVTIKVYSPTGKLLKTAPAIASATGAYAWAWNGRNSSGTMYPAGKYKFTQTLNDGYMQTTWTSYVNLSAKRLYTYTKTFTKTVAQRSAGSLSAGWLGWKFTLPSATVYKKLVFAVYGKSGTPRGLFGPHDYTYCPSTTRWDWYGCMSPYATFPASASWKSVTGSVTRNRHGATVKMYAVGGYRTAVRYARVTVRYGVLK
jgi:Bacterial Ig-like domain (group 3)/FlgD Ig-like domain